MTALFDFAVFIRFGHVGYMLVQKCMVYLGWNEICTTKGSDKHF